ncbi:GTP pyrophosphokinase [Lysinibacillus xylanilyticus]|uniref:RelA/SpoT domain-containing protein n=1 Tax=Lysinibacillus xylanilyticus TaxID=582475 RepID=A0ABT4EVV0_9BACI|nr:hypothetical protein [Lysinibacillus xylanilyticus]
MENTNDLVTEYEKKRPKYIAFTDRIVHLLEELLINKEINIHNIEGRAKEVNSFRSKIIKKPNKYVNPLNEITDLSGVRIITYYQDDVELVEKLIKEEFKVDDKNSLDKGALLKSNEFGYRSVHYILSLSEERLRLPEWSKYREYKFEVQIRTVLQHAWASISHSIQYKHEEEVPNDLKRKLFRLAGIFELADEEFMDVKKKNSAIIAKVKSSSKGDGLEFFGLNLLTITEYIQNSSDVKILVENATKVGFEMDHEPFNIDEENKDSALQLILLCKLFGIKTIGQLDSIIKDNLSESSGVFRNIYYGSGWIITNYYAVIFLLIHIYIQSIEILTLVEMGWDEGIAERVIEQLREYKKSIV